MKVLFLHARQHDTCAKLMLASVRRHMDAECIQLSDEDTPAIDGCEIARKPWGDNPMIFKMQHLAEIEGDCLVLDTDVIVQADLSPVFALPFDVALTWRDGPIYDPTGRVDVTKTMPYNCGVMWSRTPQFWRDCLAWCKDKPVGWYADQLAVAAVSKQYDTLRLHCDNFNYTPLSPSEDVSRRLAIHYKGNRKEWMFNKWGKT